LDLYTPFVYMNLTIFLACYLRYMSEYKKTKVNGLFKSSSSGIYYAYVRTSKGPLKKSLRTNKFSIAKVRLPLVIEEMKEKAAGLVSLKKEKDSLRVFSEALAEYWRLKKSEDLKPSTLLYYQQIVDFFKVDVGELDVSQLDEDFMRDWWRGVCDKYSEQRSNNILSFMKAVLDLQKKYGLRKSNPGDELERVIIKNARGALVSRDNLNAVRSSKSRYSDEAADMIEFYAYSGLRTSELASLTWNDVGEDFLNVAGAKGRGKDVVEWRKVPIVAALRVVINKRRELCVESGSIFSIKSPRFALNNACDKVGVDRMRLHDLRHLFATVCIGSGVDIPTVAKWLGHKDRGVLAMKTYGHLRDQHSITAAKRVNF